ncbi:DMT family transporter [Microbacterium sp. 10M-3C3]|uniref:EamA family transporter n=1 Tax=Microbacterium sp. 10M-3C3 TaxID=2483401 RepID=UPI001F0C8761|nr:DMT family transporter [Microbacterium sp. 10M-3C3]
MTALVAPPMVRRPASAGIVIALASALAFASSGPVMKPLLEAGWSLGAALLLRMGGAAVLLSPWLIRAVVRNPRAFVRHTPLIVGFGLTAVAGCQLFYFSAMQRIPVGVALLIQYLAPVLLVLGVWLRTRRRPAAIVLVGTGVAMLGLLLVVDLTGATFDPLGVALALCAAVCAAAYFVIAERTGDTMPPLALAAGGLVVGTVLMAVLTATGALPFVAPAVTTGMLGLAVPWFASVAWVVVVATALGYALGVQAVPRIGSRLASFVGLTEVLFAVLFAWLLLGETPGLVQAAGGALILVGVVLVRLDSAPLTRGGGAPAGEAAIVPVVPAP